MKHLLVIILVFASCSSRSKGVQSVRSLQANQMAEIGRLDSDIRELSGRIEEIEFGLLKTIDEMNAQLELFASRMPAPSQVPAEILQEDQQIASRLQGEGAELYQQALKQIRLGSFLRARETFEKFSGNYSNEQIDDNVLFWRAFCSVQLGSNDPAIVLYSDVFQKYANGDRADAALYYLADVFVATGETSDAKIALKKLLSDYPKSKFIIQARALLASL